LGCCGKLSVGVFYFSQHYPTLSNILQQFENIGKFANVCEILLDFASLGVLTGM
jgi:hypothetical protein